MAVTPVLNGQVDTDEPVVGEELAITLTENVPGETIKLEYGVSDNQGNEWVRTRLDANGATYTTVPATQGELIIVSTLMRTYDQKPAEPLTLRTTVTPMSGGGAGIPGQVAGKVLVGMSTDDYTTRVRETGPIGSDHFFVGSWSPSDFISKVKEAKARGLYAFGNMKTGDWAKAASGSLDSSLDGLIKSLNELNYPCHICFHHEPGFKTPNGAGEGGTGFDWRAMNMRLLKRVKDGSDIIAAGVVDNGYKFSPKTSGQGWTDSELDQLYTDEFLDTMDSLGADYYDGATSKTNGEPAALKVARADAWMERRGWPGGMAIGEFSFVRPVDATALFAVCKRTPERWWAILAFNSDNNNRAGIPTKGAGWNFTHDFEQSGDRLAAFKSILADPLSHP